MSRPSRLIEKKKNHHTHTRTNKTIRQENNTAETLIKKSIIEEKKEEKHQSIVPSYPSIPISSPLRPHIPITHSTLPSATPLIADFPAIERALALKSKRLSRNPSAPSIISPQISALLPSHPPQPHLIPPPSFPLPLPPSSPLSPSLSTPSSNPLTISHVASLESRLIALSQQTAVIFHQRRLLIDALKCWCHCFSRLIDYCRQIEKNVPADDDRAQTFSNRVLMIDAFALWKKLFRSRQFQKKKVNAVRTIERAWITTKAKRKARVEGHQHRLFYRAIEFYERRRIGHYWDEWCRLYHRRIRWRLKLDSFLSKHGKRLYIPPSSSSSSSDGLFNATRIRRSDGSMEMAIRYRSFRLIKAAFWKMAKYCGRVIDERRKEWEDEKEEKRLREKRMAREETLAAVRIHTEKKDEIKKQIHDPITIPSLYSIRSDRRNNLSSETPPSSVPLSIDESNNNNNGTTEILYQRIQRRLMNLKTKRSLNPTTILQQQNSRTIDS